MTHSSKLSGYSRFNVRQREGKMSSFSEQALQEKLTRLTVSQDSIETLSSWMIHHRSHAAATVTKWLQNVHQGYQRVDYKSETSQ